jgi:uncharacterized protein (DUF2062 family)
MGAATVAITRLLAPIAIARGIAAAGGASLPPFFPLVATELIASLINGFQFFLCFLVESRVVLRNAIGMPNKHQVLISLVDVLQRGTRL